MINRLKKWLRAQKRCKAVAENSDENEGLILRCQLPRDHETTHILDGFKVWT